jgi:hypothetical protein
MAMDFQPPRLMVSLVLAPVVAKLVAAKRRRSTSDALYSTCNNVIRIATIEWLRAKGAPDSCH